MIRSANHGNVAVFRQDLRNQLHQFANGAAAHTAAHDEQVFLLRPKTDARLGGGAVQRCIKLRPDRNTAGGELFRRNAAGDELPGEALVGDEVQVQAALSAAGRAGVL